MKKNIPMFQFVIDDSEESGVKAISIVGDPAFQSSMITFSKEKPKFIALSEKKMKQICAGLSLIPDVPVYRVDEIFGEYYGYFSKETIEKIVEKYHMEMNMNKLNLGHDDKKYIDAFMIEDFIVDTPERASDLKAKGIDHENLMGSWYTAFKIKSPQVFESIINGESGMGFSVEAYLNRFSVQINKNKNKMNRKSFLQKIVNVFTDKSLIDEIMNAEIFERSLVPELGFELEWGKPGEPVNKVEVDQNGNEVLSPVGPGEFKTDSGVVVVDEASNLTEVRPLPKEKAPIEPPKANPVAPPVTSGDTVTVSGTTQGMAAYPWDKCISDQLAAGYSQTAADKICGWIKANNSSQEMVTDEVLKTILSEEELACKKKKFDEETSLASGDTTNAPVVPDSSMMPIDPNAEPAPAPVSSASTSKTIADLVGTTDGDYYIEVCVEGGVITEIQVSSEVTLLRSQVTKLEEEKKVLEDKLKEPIGEPILEVPKVIKPFAEMSAYEKALHNAQKRRE